MMFSKMLKKTMFLFLAVAGFALFSQAPAVVNPAGINPQNLQTIPTTPAPPLQNSAVSTILQGNQPIPIYPAAPNQPRIRVRIKDVARIAGNDSFTLTGYGVVVGLAGTGDSDASLIQRTIANIMQNFNIIVNEGDVKAKNSASVMVTMTIRGKAHVGDTFDATVSAISDAKSLLGGTLLLTPLLGTDSQVWAIAQGPVTVGGFMFGSAAAGGEQSIKNHPNVGILTNGVELRKEIRTKVTSFDMVTFYLRQPDFTAAVQMSDSINKKFFGAATPLDSATIRIRVPNEYKDENRILHFISDVEQLEFSMDKIARVVFNEKTGTIVVGSEVKISEVAIAHGNIFVNIKSFENASQPAPFSTGGNTVKLFDQTTVVKDPNARFLPLPNVTTVNEVVNVLNALGVGPRDIMMIFHALKAAGALHAQLESM